MELVTSHRQLKHGVIMSVRDREGNEVFGGEVIGFPYKGGTRAGVNQEPDMVQIRLRSRRSQDMFLAQIGIGPKASPERRTYII